MERIFRASFRIRSWMQALEPSNVTGQAKEETAVGTEKEHPEKKEKHEENILWKPERKVVPEGWSCQLH